MKVIDGDFPTYAIKCDDVDFDVHWHNEADCWVMLEQYQGEFSDLRAHLGIGWDTWQDGVVEAISRYEREMEVKEKQAQIEAVK
jgi:hypothetical protein